MNCLGELGSISGWKNFWQDFTYLSTELLQGPFPEKKKKPLV